MESLYYVILLWLFYGSQYDDDFFCVFEVTSNIFCFCFNYILYYFTQIIIAKIWTYQIPENRKNQGILIIGINVIVCKKQKAVNRLSQLNQSFKYVDIPCSNIQYCQTRLLFLIIETKYFIAEYGLMARNTCE